MKIELVKIPVGEVFTGYLDSDEYGVVGYSGKLNIRPAFQREFVYDDKQRDEVIHTVRKNFPLNVMYWAKCHDGNYELMDGQQRTISLCQFLNGDFSIQEDGMTIYYHTLTAEEQQQIREYELMIYICEGSDKEKLEWFKIINIAGVELTQQELRNAVYTGEWLTDAKKYFSKRLCPAYQSANKYLSGKLDRQAYLETVLFWIASRENKTIEQYMAEHQHDTHASELWLYFQSVMNWTKTVFPKYRKEMAGLPWGIYYNKYGTQNYDPHKLEKRIVELMEDEEVDSRKGIYEYLLDGNEKHLNLRKFPDKIKRAVYEQQQGICKHCGQHFDIDEMEADHIDPWHAGGKTVIENCQMLCKPCNRRKSGK